MSDFLKNVENQLKGCKDKALVMAELQDHVEARKEFFEEIGYDELSGSQKADEAMGDGEIVGQRLKTLHVIDYKQHDIILFVIVLCNILIPFIVGIPRGNDAFLLPFFSGAWMLIINMLFTGYAIRKKNSDFSIPIILFAAAAGRISLSKLAYPICNLLLKNGCSENTESAYELLKTVMICILLMLLLFPNVYNLYYYRRIRQFRNTKKQNEFAKKLIALCVAVSVICAASSVPFYFLNKDFCNKQDSIRAEFVDFILEAEKNFDYFQTEGLCSYLETSEYEFEITEYKDRLEFSLDKGNWQMDFIVYLNDGYYASVDSVILNSSQAYLFTAYEKEEKLLSRLGGEELNPTNSAKGLTKAEIREYMSEIHSASFAYKCTEEENSYYYQWYANSYLYGIFGYSTYDFIFEDNICINYAVMLD